MERGLEQFFVLGLIFFAMMVDLLVRWLKRRMRGSQPGDTAPDKVVAEEEPIFENFEEEEALERAPMDARERPPMDAPVLVPAAPRAPPPLAVEEVYAHRKTEAPKGPPPQPIRQRRPRHWLKHPANARRGIVLMAVLGPCRGLER